MGFLKFVFYFILVIFILRILLRLFGPWLLRRLANRMARKMQEEATRRQNAYQQQYDPNYREEVRLNEDLKVHIPRQDKPPKRPTPTREAEAVEFEEVD